MKIGLFALFDGTSNSLAHVVAQHLTMLLDNDISVKIFVCRDFPEKLQYGIFLDQRIEWVKLSNLHIRNLNNVYENGSSQKQVYDSFSKEVEIITQSIINNVSDIDVFILYGVLEQERYLVYNLAIRKVQEAMPNIRFIAYTHSKPVKSPLRLVWPFSARYTPMSNTIYVTPTNCGRLALARQYDIPEERCRVVHSSLDILASLSEEVKFIANKTDLLSSDILIIYPARLTPGKKFDKVTTFAAAIKNKTKSTVKVVFCDFPSADINPELYKALIKRLGRALNLNDDNLLFTSDLGYKDGFPRRGVFDLFTLSNLFVCPSFSESFGLMALEAASRGNFLVLNEKVPALAELGLQLHAYFMRWDAKNFGFVTKETYYPSEQDYLQEHAEKVINLMEKNPVIHAKTATRSSYSLQWVWENQFSPLLETKHEAKV